MTNKVPKWYMKQGDYDDVIVSSRVRLARNLSEFDFQEKLNSDDAMKLVDKVKALTPMIAGRENRDFYACNVYSLSKLEKASMVENHTVSPALIRKKQPTGLILSDDESISIMINEEDHLRIQAVLSGSNIKEAYKTAGRIDDYLDSELHYAYSDRYGYLTSCMTNVGTGMRASYMLSLPALTLGGKIRAISDEVGKFGVAIRGLYGEGTKSAGFMYQVSNQKTLGLSEQDILENLEQITGQIISLERKRRISWLESNHDDIEDKVFRSYGVLKYTKKITVEDAMTLLAQVKLGVDTGLMELGGNSCDLHRLMIEIQPAGLQKLTKCGSKPDEIDRARAFYLNRHLPALHIAK